MAIKLIKAGLQTTIQDLGRPGSMHLGIAHSGAMDQLSARLANRILGMPESQPVLEMTQTGISLEITEALKIVLTGADMVFLLKDSPVALGEVISVNPGDTLRYTKTQSGLRCYMAFNRTINLPRVMNSFSTQLNACIGGYQGRQLEDGDILTFQPDSIETEQNTLYSSRFESLPKYLGHYQIRYTSAPESEQFTRQQTDILVNQTYRITPDLSRMGIRIQGNPITFENYPHMASRGLLPGAIQIPPHGQPIIAGMDAQTTGGYLRIGQIIQADLPIVGQLKPGDGFSFQHTALETAKEIYREQMTIISGQ